jgi:RNA polymerase sigma-70 factor, ECF subfamily
LPALHSERIAHLVESANSGDRLALDTLVALAYAELRRLAARYVARERHGQSVQATALVHEVYLRLLGDKGLHWENRPHFIGIAARSMRQILVERARARKASKRGGGRDRITLEEGLLAAPEQPLDLAALDEALERLATLDERQARIVELRFFGGLTVEETAVALGISTASVKRGWTAARAWLFREISEQAKA